jgi:hypothetical protein
LAQSLYYQNQIEKAMKVITKRVFTREVILLVGILVAMLLLLSSYGLTKDPVRQEQSKVAPDKGISLVKHYILNS